MELSTSKKISNYCFGYDKVRICCFVTNKADGRQEHKKKVQTFSQTQIFTFTKGDKIPGMRGCYSGGITAMSTNGPISVSMQALKIPQISQGLPNKITESLNISEVWLYNLKLVIFWLFW